MNVMEVKIMAVRKMTYSLEKALRQLSMLLGMTDAHVRDKIISVSKILVSIWMEENAYANKRN